MSNVMKSLVLALAVGCMAAIGGRADAAETDGVTVAAAVTFREMPRPEMLPEDFGDGYAASPTFLELTAIDGNKIPAVLWKAEGQEEDGGTLVVSVHGSGGSYANNPVVFLAPGLAGSGRTVLAINTRQSRDAVNTDNFFDIRNDISAAFQVARNWAMKTSFSMGTAWAIFKYSSSLPPIGIQPSRLLC